MPFPLLFCLVRTQKQMNFVSLGVCGSLLRRTIHSYENIYILKYIKKMQFCTSGSKISVVLWLKYYTALQKL